MLGGFVRKYARVLAPFGVPVAVSGVGMSFRRMQRSNRIHVRAA